MKPPADIEPEPLSTRWRADAVLVAVTAAWGVDFVVVKNLLGEMPPLTLLFWRFAAATMLLSLLLPWRRRTRGLVSDGLVLGLLLFTAVVARWFLAETLTGRGWAGGALVLAGIVVSEMRLRGRT